MIERRYRTCNLCEAMCGMVFTVDDGEITEVRGDRDDVLSRGHVCPKGPAMRELHEDPDRLRRPLRRTAKGWEEIGWDEAIAEAAERLHAIGARHGRDAVATYTGNPAGHNHGAILMSVGLAAALGSKNRFDANSQDANPKLFAAIQMFGDMMALTVPDVDRTRLLLILGGNPVASGGSVMSLGDVRGRLKAIRARGGRIVVVDPRRTETAEIADQHLFIRPGGDAALLLAMLHVIFAEGRSSPRAAEERGLDELRAIAARFPPERVAGAIGIDAATIRGLARDFAATDGAVAYGRIGICQSAFGSVGSWLVEALNVVTGNFDRPGGSMFPTPAVDLVTVARLLGVGGYGRARTRVRGLPELGGMLPAAAMAEEIETPGDGQIRAMVTLAGNPVLSVPGGERLGRALAGLDFMVSIDIYLNETTRHAHLVLPPRSSLSRGHFDLIFHAFAVRNTVKWSEPVIPPEPGSRDDWDILYELSVRLAGLRGGRVGKRAADLALRLGGVSSERAIDLMLRIGPYGDKFVPFGEGLDLEKVRRAPHGIDLGPLVPMRSARIRTPDRKVDLAPAVLVADVARIDRWLDAAPGELTLIGRRHVRSCNSWMHNIPSLVKGPRRDALLMHRDDARRLGIEDAGEVRVSGRAGAVTAALQVGDDMMPGVVSLPHGFGHAGTADTMRVAGEVRGPNVNAVTDPELLEPLTGTAMLGAVPVTVEPA